MSGRYQKKIRRVVNNKIKTNAKEILEEVQKENIFSRIGIALKIIFKYKLGERLGA